MYLVIVPRQKGVQNNEILLEGKATWRLLKYNYLCNDQNNSNIFSKAFVPTLTSFSNKKLNNLEPSHEIKTLLQYCTSKVWTNRFKIPALYGDTTQNFESKPLSKNIHNGKNPRVIMPVIIYQRVMIIIKKIILGSGKEWSQWNITIYKKRKHRWQRVKHFRPTVWAISFKDGQFIFWLIAYSVHKIPNFAMESKAQKYIRKNKSTLCK